MDRKIYGNGKIYTVDEQCPWAEAFCVEDGKITLVGTEDEVRSKAGKDAEYIDLNGNTVLPGFIDSHMPVSYTHLDVYKRQLDIIAENTGLTIEEVEKL